MAKPFTESNVSEHIQWIYSLPGDEFDSEVIKLERDLKSYVYHNFIPDAGQERLFRATCDVWWREKGLILATAFRVGGNIEVVPAAGARCKWKIQLVVVVQSGDAA